MNYSNSQRAGVILYLAASLFGGYELYGSNVYSYYFDIPFEETIRRHQTRSKSQEFGEEHMRGWWRKKDFSAVLKEQLITCEMDANSIVAKVYADLLKEE